MVFHPYPPIGVTLCVVAEDTSLNGGLAPKGTPIVLSPLAINKTVVLWSIDAEKFMPQRWSGSEDGVVSVESNYGFLIPGGTEGCIGNAIAKVEFKRPLKAAIDRHELEQDGRRDVAKAGLVVKS